MKKKILFLVVIIVCIFTIIMGSFSTKRNGVLAANPPVINNTQLQSGDLVLVSATPGSYEISYYLVGTTTSTADKFNKYNATSGYVSMKNGTYNIWAVDTNGNISSPYSFSVNTSCYDTGLTNITGDGTRELCGKIDYRGNVTNAVKKNETFSCADGYYLDTIATQQLKSDCTTSNYKFSTYNLSERYCKITYAYSCVKKQDNTQVTISSELSNLSLSNGSLTPSFASQTTSYAATVNASSVTINASLKDSNASYVAGYEPRTVNLNYGTNTFYIKVKGTNETTYTIKITRPKPSSETLSTDNKLRVLSISNTTISPSFNSNTNNYTASVGEEVGSVDITATLNDSKASFVTNYGPRTVNLVYGDNKIDIKVKSQSGSVRVYTVVVNRARPAEVVIPEPVPTSSALLESITLDNGKLDFESEVFDYNVTVENEVTNVIATVVPKNETDTVEINGGADLQVGSNELTIKVTSTDNSITNIYTIYIIRKEKEEEVSTNSLLKNLTIENHKIKFDAKKTEYTITLSQKETELNINAEVADEKSSISIEGNEKLTTGSQIKIRVLAESGAFTDYYIKVTGYQKSSNIFLTIFVVIIILAVLAYIILRILGYKIYFNLGAIKDYISNIFKK